MLARALERVQFRAWQAKFNFDEAKVPAFSLPDSLLRADGERIGDSAAWLASRRSEIVRLFENHVYGISPWAFGPLEFDVVRRETDAVQGSAVLKEIDISFGDRHPGPAIHVLLFVPKRAPKPVPVFLGLNFLGNHTVHPDARIGIRGQWQALSRYSAPEQVLPPARTRGADSPRWPIASLLERGYAVATAHYEDLEPDFPGGWRYGIRALLPAPSLGSGAPDSSATPLFRKRSASFAGPPWARPNDWGAIAAWGWGASRILDYLENDPDIRASRAVLFGHSRLAKAALWAGARDDRFAIVAANDSGPGGAALSRRRYGETIKILNKVRPHWFCRGFAEYNDKENELPVDQHMLVGLMAPRPVYISSAADDLPSDPRGEFLSASEAGKVYALFGLAGLPAGEMPGLDEPVGDTIGYHVRSGRHDLTSYDWAQFIRFADRHFGRGAAG
jgi:hypothetical protein